MRTALVLLTVVAAVACHKQSERSARRELANELTHEAAGAEARCEHGDDASACTEAAFFLDSAYDKTQLAHATQLWSRGCELGDGVSCRMLAGNAMSGNDADERLAALYYAKGCRLGDKISCMGLDSVDPAGVHGR